MKGESQTIDGMENPLSLKPALSTAMLTMNNHAFHYRICDNGHLIYGRRKQILGNFCQKCGAAFVEKCPRCSAALPSSFQSPEEFLNGKPITLPTIPRACRQCGKVFPWALRDATPADIKDREKIDAVIRLCERFHCVARQLRERFDHRQTLKIADEHDVQDLLHGLLKIYFDDIRREEWTPSYAGASARVDFLIKPEMILVEV